MITRGFVLSRESPETIQLEIPLRAPYLSKRSLKANSYNMRHQFLARLERIFAAPFFLRGRERKCSVPQGGAKVLLTQKELSRLTCPATLRFPHVPRLCGEVFGCGRRLPLCLFAVEDHRNAPRVAVANEEGRPSEED